MVYHSITKNKSLYISLILYLVGETVIDVLEPLQVHPHVQCSLCSVTKKKSKYEKRGSPVKE